MYVYVYIYIYVCVYIYIHVYVYVYVKPVTSWISIDFLGSQHLLGSYSFKLHCNVR